MTERIIIADMAAITDVGMVRKNNEDNYIIADLTAGSSIPGRYRVSYPLGRNAFLLIVSDGMGGAEFGELASEITVLAIKDALMRLPRHISAYDRLIAAVEEANNIVWNEGNNNPALKGMGATVTAALIEGDQVFIAEVGDSRAYLIRQSNIKQVTTDQSFVAQLIERGLIKPEDAIQHPRKNVILQSIGSQEIVQVAVSMFQLKQGDILLLCSDGLSNLITAAEMLFFNEALEPFSACQKLVDVAKQRGGHDNITVIVGRFEGNGLGISQQAKGLTGLLQTLSVYNPEQDAEKTHKRTQLLGNASLSNRFYGTTNNTSQENLPKVQIVTNLTSVPESEEMMQECERLLQWIEYCQQVVKLKAEQADLSAQWLENNGMYFAHLVDFKDHVERGVQNLESAKQAVYDMMKFL